MFYIIVGLWIVICVVRYLTNPEGRRKLKTLLK